MDTIYALLIVFVLYCIVSDWFMHEYSEKLNGNNFYKFKIDSFFSYQIPALKRLISLNDENLAKQPIFWVGTILPLIVASWVEYQIILLNPELLSLGSVSNLFTKSAPALYISALTPTLGVIISNIHRTIQTKKQIQVTEMKNISDSFYAHNKFILEEFKAITEKSNEYNIELSIISPNMLYKKIYEKSTLSDGADNKVCTSFLTELENNFISLNNEVVKSTKDIKELYVDSDTSFANIQIPLSGFIFSFKKITNYLCINNKNNYLDYYLFTRPSEIKIKIEGELNDLTSKYSEDKRVINYCETRKVQLFLNELFTYLGLFLYVVDKLLDIINIKNRHFLAKISSEISKELFNLLLPLKIKIMSQKDDINLIYIC
ncbi:hypothetical protein MIB43_012625 [Providencia rettgeri]|uniref:hypothetical protein n=1 Tax=Providencia rettgeri TaxID=587 RepID=UPI001F041252|nr:hypothetical protein [Providencia rettgeri]MCG9950767.1 hypothetical protein [Providencia rettgeri]